MKNQKVTKNEVVFTAKKLKVISIFSVNHLALLSAKQVSKTLREKPHTTAQYLEQMVVEKILSKTKMLVEKKVGKVVQKHNVNFYQLTGEGVDLITQHLNKIGEVVSLLMKSRKVNKSVVNKKVAKVRK